MSDPGTPITMTPEEFEEGVARAAQLVARVHRRRLVTWGFIAGLISTAIIALPAIFVVAHHNCTSISTLATANEEGFSEGIAARKSFLDNSKDRFGLTGEQFRELLRRSDASQQKQLGAIREVAHSDCKYI